jgi:hypothetical protein
MAEHGLRVATDDDAEGCLDRISALARCFYEARDAEQRAREELTAEILRATDDHDLHQETIATYCDLMMELENRRDATGQGGEGGNWSLHRTSIQQFLRKARQTAA